MNLQDKPKQIKNKELTKRKLIDAVGEVFPKEGHTGLGVNKVAKQAGVTKKLIYDYFGDAAPTRCVCIVSNDKLGFSQHPKIKAAVIEGFGTCSSIYSKIISINMI
jgi:AcrR family transcriptional regulator